MSDWTNINYAANSLLTSTKMTQNQQNFHALVEGSTGAPKIQAAAIDTDSVITVKIKNDAVDENKLDETKNYAMVNLILPTTAGNGIRDSSGNIRFQAHNQPTDAISTIIRADTGGWIFLINGEGANRPLAGMDSFGQLFTVDEAGTGLGSALKWKVYTVAVNSGADDAYAYTPILGNKVLGISGVAVNTNGTAYAFGSGDTGVYKLRISLSVGQVRWNYGSTIRSSFETLYAVIFYSV